MCCSEQRLGISLSVWLDTWGHAPGHTHPHLQPWALPAAWPPSWETLAFSSLNSRFRLRVVKSQYVQLLAYPLSISRGGSYIINTLKLTGKPGAPYPVSSLPLVNHPSLLKEGLWERRAPVHLSRPTAPMQGRWGGLRVGSHQALQSLCRPSGSAYQEVLQVWMVLLFLFSRVIAHGCLFELLHAFCPVL